MKRKLSFILSIILLIQLFVPTIFASNRSDDAITESQYSLDIANANEALDELADYFSLTFCSNNAHLLFAAELIDCYRNDAVFARHYREDPDGALDMVAGVVNNMINDNAGEEEPQRALVYTASGVPSHKQIQNNSCGAASALQVIAQQGGASNVSGSTYDAKEQTLINQTGLGAGTSSSIAVYEVVNLINNNTSAHTYAYINCQNMSRATFNNTVRNSFNHNCPVILHAIKGYIDYYPSSSTGGHYIVGYRWRPPEDTFTVNDCHYNNLYTGVHTIPMLSAYNSVNSVNNRYLIYGY